MQEMGHKGGEARKEELGHEGYQVCASGRATSKPHGCVQVDLVPGYPLVIQAA